MGRAGGWGFWVAMIVVGCGYGGLTRQMWAVRHEFEIKARSPTLIFVSTLGGLAVMMLILLQWRSRAQGSSLPCMTLAYITPFASIFMATPYLFRAVRLIVAHNPEYRYKFAKFVKWKPLAILWTLCATLVATETVLVRHFVMPASYCFATDPFLMGIFTVFGGVPSLYLARSLRNVYDPFGIRQELELVLWTAITCGAINTVVQVLVALKTLPKSSGVHIFEEFVTFVFGAHVGIWSMLVPLASRKKWYQPSKFFAFCPGASSLSPSETPVAGGILDLAARSGDIGVRFGDFCNKHHVLENWEFILRVVAFKKMSSRIDEHHRAFVEIVDHFISSTSPAQINIESTMRNDIMAYRTRNGFSQLDERERGKVLDKSLGEIVRLLEFNLLERFWQAELQRQDEELADIAKEDKNFMDIILSGEESVKGGRRGSFVTASRHKSSLSRSSQADSLILTPAPKAREDRSSNNKRCAEHELSPHPSDSGKSSRGRSPLTRSPLNNSSSSLQTLEERRVFPIESGSPGSRERPGFTYTRRSSQIRPLLSSIEASARAGSDDRSGARVLVDDVSGVRIG